MRLIIALALGAVLGGGAAVAGLKAFATAPAVAAPTTTPPSNTPPFEIERSAVHVLPSKALGRTYRVFVKLPPSYAKPENAGRRYPVLYLTDGPYTFQVASGVTRVPYNHNRLEEAILVGIDYDRETDPVGSRNRDLTPWPSANDPKVGGQAAGYLKFVKDEVIPLVEGRYRVNAARRTLAGQSYGGLFGAWVLFNDPTLFDSYILTSTSLWYAKRKSFELEADYARTHKDLKAKVFLAIGEFEQPKGGMTTDMVGDQRAFAEALRSRGYPGLQVRDEVMDGTYHETTFPVGLIHGLQWLHPAAGPKD